MKAQQIFDIVAAHLAKQGHRSVSNTGSCLYRGPAGDKCAAGVFIPDEAYRSTMEGHIFGAIVNTACADKEEWAEPYLGHAELWRSLQNAHDAPQRADGGRDTLAADFRPIKKRLYDVANRRGLSPAILDTLIFPEVWT